MSGVSLCCVAMCNGSGYRARSSGREAFWWHARWFSRMRGREGAERGAPCHDNQSSRIKGGVMGCPSSGVCVW